MKLLLKRAKILSLLILAISFLGCEEDDEGNILPAVLAGFTFDLNEETGTVSFINISENADSFEWDFGDGTSSTEIDPIKTFANGTFTVQLTASNSAGASDSTEDEIIISVPEPLTLPILPITFDGTNVDYTAGTFTGAAFEVVENPDLSGTNDTASNVGAITNIGAEFEGVFFNLNTAIDLTDDKTITMNFWAEEAIDVLVKLEEGTGADTEVSASHGGTGWEMLSFDFTSSDSFSRFTMFVDGPGTTAGTFYVDDIEQMGATGGGDMPTEAAPAPPTRDAADVISLFSDAYTDIAVDTFFAGFSSGDGVTDEQVAGDAVKLYANLDFAGVETLTETVDLSTMTNFHIDIWTATSFDFISRLVDFGGDGFGSGNDTQADERTTLTAGQWNSIDVTIADLQAAGLTATPTDFSQLILDIVDVVGTVYVDNIYFYNDSAGGGDMPTEAAPTPPSRDAADVISIFSNAYTDISVDTFYAAFSSGTGVSDVQVAGDDTKLYADLDFAGVETLTENVDLSSMTNFHIDVWTATSFDFISRLVDFGGDGFGGGNDTQADERTTLTAGQWNSIDVTIADLQAAGLTATPTDFSQLILDVVDVIGTVYVDNIYFYNDGGGGGSTCPAPPMGELLSNGGFEANSGDGACWQLNAGGGAVTIIDTDANTGTYSARLTTGTSQVPNLKQERFAGSIAGNQGVQVTFRYKITSAFVDGSILQVLAFSEFTTNPAVSHDLGNAMDVSTVDVWQTYTGTFTTDAAIEEGISLLIQATCGGAATCAGEVLIDDVVVTEI